MVLTSTISGEQTLLLLTAGFCAALLLQQLARWLVRRGERREAWAGIWASGAVGWSVARLLVLAGPSAAGRPFTLVAALSVVVMGVAALGLVGNFRRPRLRPRALLGLLTAAGLGAVVWAVVPGPWAPTRVIRPGIGGVESVVNDPGLAGGGVGLAVLFVFTVALLRQGLGQGMATGTGGVLGLALLCWIGTLCNDLLHGMGLWHTMPLHALGILVLAATIGMVLSASDRPASAASRSSAAPVVGPRAASPAGGGDGPDDEPTARVSVFDDEGKLDRTAEIGADEYRRPNRMLLDALAEAREASEKRQRFLARASHELRTPLHGILGMTGLALEGQLDPTRRRYLQAAHRSAEELLAMVEELLALARAESQEFELSAEPIGLLRFVDDTIELVAQQAADKGIELYTELSPGLPSTVIGDPQRLRQVLVNLLGNAVKFTERGHVVLRVSEVPAAFGRVGLRVEVADTGPGIPVEEQALVLEPFGQGAQGRGRGTGLGLAVCVELLRRMGSELELDSAEGEGTRFSFRVELDLEDPTDEITVIDPVLLKGTRVLVVDDHPGSGASLKAELSAWRLRTTVVSDGAAALAELRQAREEGEPYAVVFADADMQGMGGWELLDAIGEEGGTAPAVVLMLPPDAPPGRGVEALERGAQAVVSKPLRSADLHEALLRAVGAQDQPPPVTGSARPAAQARGRRVLVADDRSVNREVARAFLETMGCAVVTVRDGRTAVEAAQAEHFDLILMDVGMPGMLGDEATRRIREAEAGSGRRSVPVVALTAHASAADRERFVRAGMDAVLQKPLTREALRDVIDRLAPPSARAGEATSRRGDDRRHQDPAGFEEVTADDALADAEGSDAELQTLPMIDDDTGDGPSTGLDELPSGPLDPRTALASGLSIPLPPDTDGGEVDLDAGHGPVFDAARLDEVADGSMTLKLDLIDVFLAELPRYEEWLREALLTGQAAELERVGHALAGASANLALVELSRRARRLCDTARRGDTEGAAWIVVDVLAAVQRGRSALLRTRDALQVASEGDEERA